MLGIKQDALAHELGDDWNQRKVSLLEQKEVVEPAILAQVSTVLKLPVEVFQSLDEEGTVTIISNQFDNGAIGYQRNEQCTFNPLDKVMELFERLLASEKEKVELMKEIVGKMK